jgi:hypothetical protein
MLVLNYRGSETSVDKKKLEKLKVGGGGTNLNWILYGFNNSVVTRTRMQVI